MTGFNHTLAGTIIALSLKEPLLIAPVALISHFVLDAIPHFGQHPKLIPYNNFFKKYLLFDACMCFLVLGFAIWLSPLNWFILAWGAAWATLPDFLWPFRDKSPTWTQWFFTIHHDIQLGERRYGWTYESVYFILGIALLIGITFQ